MKKKKLVTRKRILVFFACYRKPASAKVQEFSIQEGNFVRVLVNASVGENMQVCYNAISTNRLNCS